MPDSNKSLNMNKISILLIFSFLLTGSICAQNTNVLDLRNRAEVIDNWLDIRFEQVVPELMRRNNIDMWVLVAREYNEDPVLLTMLPATWQSSRRRTILVFFDRGDEGVERIAVARYSIGRFFRSEWNPDEVPDQWERLAQIITERNPQKIAVNVSSDFGLADGISYTDYTEMKERLSDDQKNRLVSGENLAIGWLETRTAEEISVYRLINRIAHEIVEEGLSEKVITPGVTTTADVQWWYRERIRELKLTAWFHPSVSIQRSEAPEHTGDFSGGAASDVIQPGDLLHMDFGITYLRLSTDTQRMAYVLKPGETEAPQDLRDALKIGNRLQDILTDEFRTGRTGNEILFAALRKAEEEGINATIYTHPIGFQGHGAGPTIGLWDQQGGVPGKGDYPLFPNTAHSIELNAEVFIPAWNRNIRIMLEEDAIFDGEKVWYTDGRMTELYLIPRVQK
jgi:Xaa-Pro aminopeptidase